MHYLSITAFTGNYGAGQDRLGQAGFLHGSDLIVDDDGRFEIFVGPERRGDNWLQTNPSRPSSRSGSSSWTAPARCRSQC